MPLEILDHRNFRVLAENIVVDMVVVIKHRAVNF